MHQNGARRTDKVVRVAPHRTKLSGVAAEMGATITAASGGTPLAMKETVNRNAIVGLGSALRDAEITLGFGCSVGCVIADYRR